MRTATPLAAALLLAGCMGSQTSFATATVRPADATLDCAVAAIADEGLTVKDRDASGLLNAERGTDWLRVQVVPGDLNQSLLRVRTSDSDTAREAAQEIVAECGT